MLQVIQQFMCQAPCGTSTIQATADNDRTQALLAGAEIAPTGNRQTVQLIARLPLRVMASDVLRHLLTRRAVELCVELRTYVSDLYVEIARVTYNLKAIAPRLPLSS